MRKVTRKVTKQYCPIYFQFHPVNLYIQNILSQNVTNYIDFKGKLNFYSSRKNRFHECFEYLAEKISRLKTLCPLFLLLFFFLLFFLFTTKTSLLKGFSARWKIVRINLLMADSLEGINRLRKSCSTHAKNCGRISEIVSRLAPRAREIIDSILSGRAHKMAGARWLPAIGAREEVRIHQLMRIHAIYNTKFSTRNPFILF